MGLYLTLHNIVYLTFTALLFVLDYKLFNSISLTSIPVTIFPFKNMENFMCKIF